MRLYKLTLSYGFIYDFQVTNRREGGNTSCRGRSRKAPGLHLERARDRAGGSRTAWRADYWRGGVPGLGVGWSDSLKSYKPSQPYEIAKNGEKMGGFAHVFAYKSLKKRHFSLQST